ncbi:Thiol-disulfide isomerase or thioredoxin [Pelagirhabdus alkalitolerans]|uniref:Thiol-disulfide isomerase or thioredoxin n=1 Tax=Pelagirhabdus alkalitolerans TaxID=1612202 RepID=A0A1G6LQF7_9BACI|nr:TlpA disulfide reductase family protein [Pelagirhabdus alkalitolerans]SDC45429.1 Thiol-disulfide isomerase or thioredoxin [Pelagirhabdus alkalitolerans]
MLAPNFSLPYIDDPSKTYQLSDDLGKIVVLTFWTSWCPDCSQDLPLKERLYQTVDSEKMVFRTVNVSGREPKADEAIRYFDNFLSQPTVVDDGLNTYRAYDCMGVPTTVIIDQEGKIIEQFTDQASSIEIMQSISRFI